MAARDVYQELADLQLWLKLQAEDTLVMSDIPDIIPLRWTQFRDKWNFFRERLESLINGYTQPDLLREQLNDFTDFINTQKTSTAVANPFEDKDIFYRYYTVFDIFPIDFIPISNNETDLIEREIVRVNGFTRTDFIDIKESLRAARDEEADKATAGDDDYNEVFNRSSVAAQTSLDIQDNLLMQTLQNGIKTVDFILANLSSVETVSVDPFALAKANANNPEIDIRTYNTGRLAKLQYGEDLTSLANRFFGDPDRWIEIAIANGLKPPYIDEVGERLDLISNASGNQINIDATNSVGELNIDKVFINQVVLLQSDTQTFPEQRIITNVREIPVSGNIVIELDGDDDLDKYKLSENAHIRVFKPNTINSGFYVLIPSNEPLPEDAEIDLPFFLQTKGEDEKRQKVDLALDSNGDLIFNPTDDLNLSYGIDNAVQAIKLKFAIEEGELHRHPDYGLIAVQGTTNNDIGSIRASIIDSITEQITADPRYERIERLDVEYFSTDDPKIAANAFFISIGVRLAGSEAVIPITFTVNIR